MEGSTPPCQRPPGLLLSAPCSCRVPAELAGWRLQHKGCQPHHGDGGPAAAWPRQAEDLYHRSDITELFLLCHELQRLKPMMVASGCWFLLEVVMPSVWEAVFTACHWDLLSKCLPVVLYTLLCFEAAALADTQRLCSLVAHRAFPGRCPCHPGSL